MNIILKNLNNKQFKAIKLIAEAFDVEFFTVTEWNELEDQGLLKAMNEAHKEGYLTSNESIKVIEKFRNEDNNF